MTQTADRADVAAGPFAAEPVARRPLLSRLSLGHLIMILAGLLAFLLVLAVLRERGTVIEIAVAAEQIDAGTALGASDVAFASVTDADDSLLVAFMTRDAIDRAVAEGWVATRTLRAGVPLASEDFRREAATSDLRAMSIPIGAEHAVNGAIVPGDRVDIIGVRRDVAEYVAVDVEVIAVATESGGVRGGFAITVAVDDVTSLRLALAINNGSFEIVRSTGAAPADPSGVYPPPSGADPAGG